MCGVKLPSKLVGREREKKHTHKGGEGDWGRRWEREEDEEGKWRSKEVRGSRHMHICVHTHTNILHHTACEHRLYKKYTVWVLSSLGI